MICFFPFIFFPLPGSDHNTQAREVTMKAEDKLRLQLKPGLLSLFVYFIIGKARVVSFINVSLNLLCEVRGHAILKGYKVNF